MPTESQADATWMWEAIAWSRRCPPSLSAYSVGAVLVSQDGTELTRGFSRESDIHVHAEEAALAKLSSHSDLTHATLYSTLEPCTQRRSRPRSCTQLILEAGIGRVVVGWREPALFVADCVGVETLRLKGVTVTEMSPRFAAAVRAVNAHLVNR